MSSADSPSTRLATRLSFLVAGFGIACWAPMVPYARDRLGVDEAVLGGLLLCLGTGSVLAMLATGALSSRYGTRPVILAGGIALAVILPFLAIAPTTITLGLALLVFGAALGSLDVAMNIHAVDVERDAARPLMSGFHALFSIGGFTGAAMMTLLLSLGVGPLASGMIGSLLMMLALILAAPRLLRTRSADDAPHFAVPRGIVLLLAGLAAITFLAEGALLDWSALLITDAGLVAVKHGGLGYMLFAIAMTLGRLTGDRLTAQIGDRAALFWGGIVAVFGFAVLLLAPMASVAMAGFVLIGLGAANIVPVLFRQAANQTIMPPGLAVAAITTTGYAGILLGPAAIGLVSSYAGLTLSFWMLAGLLCLVPLTAGLAVSRR
ncbi:MFS transporter [Altererythrobacter xixiisoli]|uniref:MFS transporter n=1 Tax=Croceibacterium xixiisoli TaxID=1476466 RepID=A0A6I4TZ00_9SPHN|nr:MFS transporter [Croceibacterium xixiisoli]MXP00531.1 MFS transporter [Croceibacterium xixiisoli]